MADSFLSLDRFTSIEGVSFAPRFSAAPSVVIVDAFGHWECSLYGAHVHHWQPHGQAPVLFTSPEAHSDDGKAIRGGVPVCWPRFANDPANDHLPFHGRVRTAVWKLQGVERLANGGTQLQLTLDAGFIQAHTQLQAELRLTITSGNTFSFQLTSNNIGTEAITISEALHSYFHVGDVRRIQVHGLGNPTIINKVADGQRHALNQEPFQFTGATDFVALDTPGNCHISDPVLGRDIHIACSNSASTVVWNPWQAAAAQMNDLSNHSWHQFCCIETANCMDNLVTLASGEQHTLSLAITARAR